jgi:STIP1 family protein 1
LGEEGRKEIEAEWEGKMEALRGVFEAARPKEEKRREVPDWAVDDISFCVMVDPVIVSILNFPFSESLLLAERVRVDEVH